VEPKDILAERRDNELVHVRELRTVLLPIMAEYRARLDAQEGAIVELTRHLAIERSARLNADAHLADDHQRYVAGTWEVHVRAWWTGFQWRLLRIRRRLRDAA